MTATSSVSNLHTLRNAFRALTPHAQFYPVNPDKSPACKKLRSTVTTNPRRVAGWMHRHHGIGARIKEDSRLFVLDLESPAKQPGVLGPDGLSMLDAILDDNDVHLPPAPTTQTPNEGRHIYLLAHGDFRARHQISAWPGIDILAANSNVILPGSRSVFGNYRQSRGFDHLPEAPARFMEVLAERQVMTAAGGKTFASIPLPIGETSEVTRRQWYLLRRNKYFWTMWRRCKTDGDRSLSAYEFHIAKACFCCGLQETQVVAVLRCWWRAHELANRERKFVRGVMPSAWDEVAEWVAKWKLEHQPKARGRKVSMATHQVLSLSSENPEWTPKRLSDETGLEYSHVLMTLRRHTSRTV